MTSEAATRKNLIDTALRLAGWQLDDPTQVVEEYVIDPIDAGVAPRHHVAARQRQGDEGDCLFNSLLQRAFAGEL